MAAGYFFRNPFFLPWLFPGLTWRLSENEKVIYLTFDDGPVPGPTEFVLDELARIKAKATFFCIGDNVKKHPAIFQRIITEGHAVGNHTHNHLSGWQTSVDMYLENINLCRDAMMGGTLKPSGPDNLFRPPYGRITRRQISALTDYQIIMWDVLTNDYAKNLSRESCLHKSIKATRPGSIVVFHDSLKAERNMTYALPLFLDHFKTQGYDFKSLP